MRKHIVHVTHLSRSAAAALAVLFLGCGDAHTNAPEDATIAMGKVTAARGMASSAVATNAPAEAPAPRMSTGSDEVAAVQLGDPFPPAADPVGAMLVRHGEASIEVHHVDEAMTKTRQVARDAGGFVGNTSLRNGKHENPSASLEIRVPTAKFDAMLAALGALGKVETVSATVEDVGEEYVDLGARATNARRVEARFVEMLSTRTGKLADVLTVEQELARVRQEIERLDARSRFLERRAALSSLTVTLHEPVGLIDRRGPGPLAEAIGVAWQRMIGVFAWGIAALGIIVPVGVLVGAALLLWRRTRRPGRDGSAAVHGG